MFLASCAGGDDILGSIDDLPEVFAFERRLRDNCQVTRGGVVALVVQTMGIVEVRVLAAEGVGALIHHTHKISNGPCNIFRDHIRRVIAGADHHAVQKILQRDLLADLEPHDAAVLIET